MKITIKDTHMQACTLIHEKNLKNNVGLKAVRRAIAICLLYVCEYYFEQNSKREHVDAIKRR